MIRKGAGGNIGREGRRASVAPNRLGQSALVRGSEVQT